MEHYHICYPKPQLCANKNVFHTLTSNGWTKLSWYSSFCTWCLSSVHLSCSHPLCRCCVLFSFCVVVLLLKMAWYYTNLIEVESQVFSFSFSFEPKDEHTKNVLSIITWPSERRTWIRNIFHIYYMYEYLIYSEVMANSVCLFLFSWLRPLCILFPFHVATIVSLTLWPHQKLIEYHLCTLYYHSRSLSLYILTTTDAFAAPPFYHILYRSVCDFFFSVSQCDKWQREEWKNETV